MYVLRPGGDITPLGNFPANILAWAVLALLITAMGLLPFWAGIRILFTRDRFVFSPRHELKSQAVIGRFPIWSRRYPLSKFEQILVRHQRLGAFGGSWHFIVSCAGPTKRIEVAAFRDRPGADVLAADLAARLGLPVVFNCDEGRCES